MQTSNINGECRVGAGRNTAGGDIQYWTGSAWAAVSGAVKVSGSGTVTSSGVVRSMTNDWEVRFNPVNTTRLRIYAIHTTGATGQKSNPTILEWYVYCQ